jgi:CubicO group peptidase (beta-lactamase class C family)
VAPGAYSYSNAGYNTLGAIIEVVSGLPLEAFMKSRLYDPLGMTDTLNHADPDKLERMATVYYGRHVGGKGSGKVEFMRGFTPGDPPDFSFVRASGGLITTASDYARFLEMYRLGGVYGGRRILKEKTVQAAIAGPGSSGGVNGPSQSYGFGWMVSATGNYSHGGSDGTMAWIDPAREIIGMILTQSPGGNNPTAEFRRLVAEAVK